MSLPEVRQMPKRLACGNKVARVRRSCPDREKATPCDPFCQGAYGHGYAAVPYPPDAKPVFVGHYWMSGRQPQLLAQNVSSVDYSVAKGGFLCAYRWHGEQQFSNDNFFWVGRCLVKP